MSDTPSGATEGPRSQEIGHSSSTPAVSEAPESGSLADDVLEALQVVGGWCVVSTLAKTLGRAPEHVRDALRELVRMQQAEQDAYGYYRAILKKD